MTSARSHRSCAIPLALFFLSGICFQGRSEGPSKMGRSSLAISVRGIRSRDFLRSFALRFSVTTSTLFLASYLARLDTCYLPKSVNHSSLIGALIYILIFASAKLICKLSPPVQRVVLHSSERERKRERALGCEPCRACSRLLPRSLVAIARWILDDDSPRLHRSRLEPARDPARHSCTQRPACHRVRRGVAVEESKRATRFPRSIGLSSIPSDGPVRRPGSGDSTRRRAGAASAVRCAIRQDVLGHTQFIMQLEPRMVALGFMAGRESAAERRREPSEEEENEEHGMRETRETREEEAA